MPQDEFKKAWSGVVLIAYPDGKSVEPDYAAHEGDIVVAEEEKFS